MTRHIVCAAIVALFYGFGTINPQDASVQTKPKEAAGATFKVKTDLMEVRTIVTDRKGRIVENLKKEDFELLENDQQQEINFFSISQAEREEKQPAPQAEMSKAAGLRTAKTEEAAPEDNGIAKQRARDRLTKAPLRTTLLFVDNIHLSFANLNWVKQALRRFIQEKLTDQDMVALAASGGTLGIASQFSRDRNLLRYAIEQIQTGPSKTESFFSAHLAADVLKDQAQANRLAIELLVQEGEITRQKFPGESEAAFCSRLCGFASRKASQVLNEASYYKTNMLSVLKEYAEQMRNLSGKRMIVVFSDGFTSHDSIGGMRNGELQAVISSAVRSGVVIYSIDAKGLSTTIDASRRQPSTDTDPTADDGAKDPRCRQPGPGDMHAYAAMTEQDNLNGLHSIAQETGGKLFQNTNDLNDGIGQAFDANRFYYVLSYYPPEGGDSRQFRNIKARIRNHPEYIVQTPKGYLLSDITAKPADETAKTPQQRLLKAIRSPLPKTDLDVSARADFQENEADDKQVSLSVYFEGDKFQYEEDDDFRNVFALEILYAIYDSSGKQVDAISARVEGNLTEERLMQAETSGYMFSRRLNLKPGLYQMRIGVREEGTDRTGTAAAWIEVPELAPDKLEISSLILRNPLQKKPDAKEGIDVSELEQIQMVQGIPLYERGKVCNYFFRIHRSVKATAQSELSLMRELFKDGKPVKQEQWQPVPAEKMKNDSKGWFDVDGEVMLGGFDPGIYELRVSVKEGQPKKIIQRTIIFSIE